MILDVLLENQEFENKFKSLNEGCKKMNEDCCDHDDDDRDDDDCMGGLCEEDPETDALIVEAMLKEALGTGEELETFLSEEAHMYVKMGLLSERSIVRLDKAAKLTKYESQAVLAIAKEKGDRDFKKLKTVYKMRKVLLDKLEKKYYNEAKRRAKDMMKKSKSMVGQTAKKIK